MSLPPGTRLTNQIAHDICVREAAAATIDGTIASLGKNYVVTLQAIGCRDGATIAHNADCGLVRPFVPFPCHHNRREIIRVDDTGSSGLPIPMKGSNGER